MENTMSAEVNQASPVEHHKVMMSRKNTSSGSSTTGPKVSIFAAKSGFIIPKNKLLGSLVPVFKGGKKPGGIDAANEESTNQVLRKTKWGPDPTQDAAVKKGRALAYQTRVDQITQQLKSGIPESGGAQDSQVADQHADPKLSNQQIDSKDSELLKLEWREIIGEILKLDPSYKAPPDYEPLLKEATVPIPIKDHPRSNFVGLIFGPGGETQKRLEKDTGAKIQVCGTKANTGEKVEISPSGGNDTQVAYKELNVHVSADTFEKVDGAIALIELLLTSVSGNLMAGGNNMDVLKQGQEASSPFVIGTSHLGVGQSVVGPAQVPQQGQFQYQGLQFPAVLAQAPGHPPSFIPSLNSSAPIRSNSLSIHSSPLNPITMPSLFGPQPVPASGSFSVLQNASLVPSWPQLPMQVPSHPYPPRNFPLPASQPSSAQANIFAPLPFTGNQPPPAMLSPVSGSLASSVLQPVSSVPPGPQSERPLTPVGISSGWSASPIVGPASLGNTGLGVPPMVSFQGPRSLVRQPGFPSSAPPSNMPAANVVSSVFPSGPSTMNVPMNHPTGASSFASVPPPQMGSSSIPIPIQSSPVGMAAAPLPHASESYVPGSMPISSPVASKSQATPQFGITGSLPGHAINPTPTRPPTTPQPLNSGPSDFTFQLHHSRNSASQLVPRPNNQSAVQDTRFPRPPMQPPSSQVPSFRFPVPNSISSPGMHSFPSPWVGNQMGQTQVHMPHIPFAGNSTGTLATPRGPAFPNASPIMPPTRNFSPTPQLPNMAGPIPPRPPNPLQLQQNYPTPATPRGNFMAPNQQPYKNSSFAFSPGGQQIYDPFSPSSVPNMPQHQGKGRKSETDPKFEDLMTSVGEK